MPVSSSQTGESLRGAVKYVSSKAETAERRNLFGRDAGEVGREMELTAEQRPRTEKPAYHTSISYAEEHDQITDEEMISDAEAFLEKRGLGNHQAYIATHRDEDHPHAHIVVNRVSLGGEELWRDSFDYDKNMSALREIEQERGRISPRDVVSEEEG